MLARNQEAQQLHDQGLSALDAGHINYAIEDYGSALEVLERDDLQSIPIQVQTARIMRDKGFTHARAAMLHLSPPAEKTRY